MGDKVWYKHPTRCWGLGTVVAYEGAELKVSDTRDAEVHTVVRDETHPCDASHMRDIHDIALMNNMHEGVWAPCTVV